MIVGARQARQPGWLTNRSAYLVIVAQNESKSPDLMEIKSGQTD